jgi:hypothetical protein
MARRGWQGLFAELKRRRVVRVAAVYGATAFVVLEAAALLAAGLALPGWVFSALTVLVIVGFPIAVVLSWVFDLTPDGVQRAPDAWERAHLAHHAAKVAMLLGRNDDAIRHIADALRAPSQLTRGYIRGDIRFGALRGDPRWQRLVEPQ